MDDGTLTITLPFPPSVNTYYRHVGFRTLISREGRAYRRKVCAILRQAGVRPLDGRLEVTVVVHPPDLRRRDADNLLKCLLDSMQHGGAYVDDSQIRRLHVEMDDRAVPGGQVTVHITPFVPTAA